MRGYAFGALLCLSAAFAVGAAPADSPFPTPPPTPLPTPTPAPAGTVLTLVGDSLYVVNWKTDGALRVHPAGLVALTKEVGPITLRGRFADGAGKVETRKFAGPTVYILEAVAGKSGRVEIDYIPFGFKADADIFSTTLDVNAGQAPQPPPIPDPKPNPTPDPTKVDKVWVVLVEQAGVPRTVAVAQLINDPYWLTLRPKHDWRHYVSDSPVAVANKYTEIANEKGYPAVIIMNAADTDKHKKGEVLKAFKAATITDIDAAVKGVTK